MTAAAPFPDCARAEIAARHAFFAEWFTGRAPQADLARALAAFAPDFRRIAPDGGVQDHAALRASLAAARGCRPAGYAIRAEDIALVWNGPKVALLTYLERQEGPGAPGPRRASAVLAPCADAPCGAAWLFVRETWIGEGAAPVAPPLKGAAQAPAETGLTGQSQQGGAAAPSARGCADTPPQWKRERR
ncbi:DUF4440 domain-containing protein (plasmid) [Paroceanicella profunda]|uniref:DUF4440 domain-containing protein n=1 Tax=Paroceanicella profunda TaxID=2579971 RepID=A0A5B8G2D4_9RHOB|nr:DUF4440 domain-containing protein [Paroceanicella profunda]QDL94234.1 DUF4440 domain-containing protein [Paroceanicella profunda]